MIPADATQIIRRSLSESLLCSRYRTRCIRCAENFPETSRESTKTISQIVRDLFIMPLAVYFHLWFHWPLLCHQMHEIAKKKVWNKSEVLKIQRQKNCQIIFISCIRYICSKIIGSSVAHVMLHTNSILFALCSLSFLAHTLMHHTQVICLLGDTIHRQNHTIAILTSRNALRICVAHTHATYTARSLFVQPLSERGPIATQQNSQREPIALDHASVRCGKLKLAQFYKIRSAKKSNIIKSLIVQYRIEKREESKRRK